MIKAVFFDLYQTLIHYHPPREEVLSESLARRDIKAPPAELRRPILAGDEFFYRENARKRAGQRTEAETRAMWWQYQTVVLKTAGIEPQPELVASLLADMQRTTFKRVLFADVLPAFKALSGNHLKLGLISNVDKDINPLLDELGLSPYFDVVLTSSEVAATKPEPRIFKEAVKRAGVAAAEAIYVGDQYEIDVMGARGAGLKALLLDRDDYRRDVAAEEKIKTLKELKGRLDGS